MAIRKDRIIVVDLEMTCWEGYTAPPGQENEIIEIGVCWFDPRDGRIEEKRSIMVRPVNSVVSPFCTQLTTITQEQVERDGIAFDVACQQLEEAYDTRNRLWASWGAFDMETFKAQCRRRRVRYPFSRKHANLKRVFADLIGQRVGMTAALRHLNLEAEGVHHRGDDDAYNTARILHQLYTAYGPDILRRYGF